MGTGRASRSGERAALVIVRPAVRADLPRLTEIYNYYVVHTPVTFDVEPYTVEARVEWFEQFALSGRHRLWVAEEHGMVHGYAGTTPFRGRCADETTVETTIYCALESQGKGYDRRLYAELFASLQGEDIHRIVAGYTLPNSASAKLHEVCGSRVIGAFSQVGRKLGQYWDVAWAERPMLCH